MSKRKTSKEESLFNVDGMDVDVPPSPLEQEEKRRRAKERERERAMVRTLDERAASASELMAEWVQYMQGEGLSDTSVPTEIKTRVGRTLRLLIKREYLYEEIVFALKTFTVKDLRNRKYTPRTGNLEIYARQYRGENLNEREANEEEQERLRREALAAGKVPTSGNRRQNQRDASMVALAEASRAHKARLASRGKGIAPVAAPMREIEGGRGDA